MQSTALSQVIFHVSKRTLKIKKKKAEFDSVQWNDIETVQKTGMSGKGHVQAPESHYVSIV